MTSTSVDVRTQPPPATNGLGLTSEEAARRASQYGLNDPAPTRHGTLLVELLHLFLNPLVIILLTASLVSFVLGSISDSAIIFLIVFFGISINFIQTYRSRQAINKLRQHVTPTATVFRDGKWCEVQRNQIVPGDLVRLCAGDLVPADARLIESHNLYVQQAALTGESLPSEKDSNAKSDKKGAGPESPSHVFTGTSVVSGIGIAEIVATGPRTAFGAIAQRLAARPEETEFERSMKHFGILIARAVFFLVLFIVTVRVALHKDAFESFVFAVALAVGLTPEFLPMITSVTLARGAIRMAREHVVVKHLSAIQNLGAVDVLCSDKTGTLTSGEMVLNSCIDGEGNSSDRPFLLAYLNSKFEAGIRSPLEIAILKKERPEAEAYRKCDEIPFDFDRRRLSIIVEENNSEVGNRLLITKGAPEGIVSISSHYQLGNRVIPFTTDTQNKCRDIFRALSNDGFRVIAVAFRTMPAQHKFSVGDEHSLVLAGYLAFSDPPKSDAAASLAALKRDGIEVKILTGDNELVARHVCEQVGLQQPTIVLGEELEHMSDTALQHVAEQTTVFARVTPMQKHRVIHALRLRDHVVGYIGDGINDAPSLQAADVGISVASAVDVAREAADIILLKSGLQILHKGIMEGRRASANVMKYLLMGTSSNFGNMLSMAGASGFLPFLPMLPTQVLLNNFLYDTAQIAIPTDTVDDEYIRLPHRWNMALIRNFMIFIGPISSLYDFLTFFVLLHFFHARETEFHTGWFIESLATQTLVLFVIRTMRNPLKSRPSWPLAFTSILVVIVGCLIPYSPLAGLLRFARLPGRYFVFLAVSTVTYLLVVEVAKRCLVGSLRS